MKKMKKWAALLLVCALLIGGIPLHAAAAGLSLTYSQTADGRVILGLEGIPQGTVVHGVALEVTLAGVFTSGQISLTPADPLAYSPGYGAQVSTSAGRTTATVYLVSNRALNGGTALTLGAISASGMGIIPESAKVLLMDSATITGGLGGARPETVPVVQGPGGEFDLPFGDSHAITAPQAPHGTYQVLSAARENQVVTVYVQPDPGYKLGTLTVTAAGKPVALLDMGGGQYTFRMPGADVALEAVFTASGIYLPFEDVPESDWSYPAVQYVYERGMMNGTDKTVFSPATPTSRGMIVTILHRLEGSPAEGANSFTDVPAGSWFEASVAWAAEKGVVLGYGGGLFGPGDVITREQMVTILHRYATAKGYDVSATTDLSQFSDASHVSGFASAPISWAVGCGLINGTGDGLLEPQGSATRAQAATILMRFCQNIAHLP